MEFIKSFLKTIIELPLLIYIPLIIGLITYGKFIWSKRVVTLGAALLILFSVPLVPKFISKPLFTLVPLATKKSDVDLIIVPTAGVVLNPMGEWQPSFMSMHRVIEGVKTRDRFKRPLLVIGGTPIAGEATEADTIIKYMNLENLGILINKNVKNSYETAQAVQQMSINGKPVKSVMVVTSKEHILRMSLTLQSAGLKVVALPVATSRGWEDYKFPRDYYPNLRGLQLANYALKEYVGIIWYLLSGQIKFQALFQEQAQ
ncbi:MAG: YdcF family protein [Rhodospirillales bacterium]|nr:YdcF family protein [Rhodospirillales bacterium]